MKKVNFVASIALCCVSLLCCGRDVEEGALVSKCTMEEELYFANRNVSDVIDIAATVYHAYDGAPKTRELRLSEEPLSAEYGDEMYSGFYLYTNEAGVITYEIHVRTRGRTKGSGSGIGMELRQVGPDIYGRVSWYMAQNSRDARFAQSWKDDPSSANAAYDDETKAQTARVTGLKLTFDLPPLEARTVTFLGKDGVVLDTCVVPANVYAAEAPEPPVVEGYVFAGWDCDFSRVREDLVVRGVYHKLYTVTFVDGDGVTVLETQVVEETQDAVPPDMSEREDFMGWDSSWEAVSGDLTIRALYGTIPEDVRAVAEGTEWGEGCLIWGGEEGGVWDSATQNWYSGDLVRRDWIPGAMAIFPGTTEVEVSGDVSVGRMVVLGDASEVVLGGDALEFVSGASVEVSGESVVRFESALVGEAGLTVRDWDEGEEGDFAVEVAGNYAIEGVLLLSNGVMRVVGEGMLGNGDFTQDLQLRSDAMLVLGSSVHQEMSGLITLPQRSTAKARVVTLPGTDVVFNSNKNGNWTLEVGGVAMATGNNSLPSDKGGTMVLPGAELELGIFDEWTGPAGSGEERPDRGLRGLTVYTNGLLRLTDKSSVGYQMPVIVQGGVVTNASEVAPTIHKVFLRDGARFVGMGVEAGSTMTWGKSAYMDVAGTSPSFFEAETLQVGTRGGDRVNVGADGDYVAMNFQVADVTGDAQTDLWVSSRITERVSPPLYMGDMREHVGLFKSGEGTLELTGAGSVCTGGVFKVEAGTVRFGPTCSGQFGAFVLRGDAVLDCAGGEVAFEDSSAMEWTEGATLTLMGVVRGTTLRFGTDGFGLTPEQVECLRAGDPSFVVKVNSRGYVQLSRPETLLLFR